MESRHCSDPTMHSAGDERVLVSRRMQTNLGFESRVEHIPLHEFIRILVYWSPTLRKRTKPQERARKPYH